MMRAGKQVPFKRYKNDAGGVYYTPRDPRNYRHIPIIMVFTGMYESNRPDIFSRIDLSAHTLFHEYRHYLDDVEGGFKGRPPQTYSSFEMPYYMSLPKKWFIDKSLVDEGERWNYFFFGIKTNTDDSVPAMLRGEFPEGIKNDPKGKWRIANVKRYADIIRQVKLVVEQIRIAGKGETRRVNVDFKYDWDLWKSQYHDGTKKFFDSRNEPYHPMILKGEE